MGKKSREKGAAGERAAAQLLRVVFPRAARRAAGEESQERQGVDLKNTPGWAVQVNVASAPAPLKKFREASGALLDGEKALVLFRQSSRTASTGWLACLRGEDLVELLELTESSDLEFEATNRGFAIGEFRDLYGARCSIQKSSLATADAIWLGVSDPDAKVLVPGEGWVPGKVVDEKGRFGTEASVTTRMHLSQQQVRRLLPALVHFVRTGELPS